MSRRVLFGPLAISVALVFAVPALAKSNHRARPLHKSHHKLVMSRHLGRRVSPLNGNALIATLPPQAVLTYQGYSCSVTVAYGPTGAQTFNTHTTDSTEFYIPYTVNSTTYDSVTSNCIGKLPAGKTAPTTIVTHVLTSCSQFDPFVPGNHYIFGSGISTTFPDGLYSETCNTPNDQ